MGSSNKVENQIEIFSVSSVCFEKSSGWLSVVFFQLLVVPQLVLKCKESRF